MNRYFSSIFRIFTLITLVGFISCSDDNDDIVPDITTDSYIGTAILTYIDSDGTQPETENFTAIVFTHKAASDKLSIDIHQQSQFFPQCFVKESILMTNMPFTASQTGAASPSGAHFNQSELNINYNFKNAEPDKNGRTLLSVKFCGQPNPAEVKEEIVPFGKYDRVSQKGSFFYCFSDEEYNMYNSDINNIPAEKWIEYPIYDDYNYYININPCERDAKKLSVEYFYIFNNQKYPVESMSGDFSYTVNFDNYTMSVKPLNRYSLYTILPGNISVTNNTSTKLNKEEETPAEWPEGAIGYINVLIENFILSE